MGFPLETIIFRNGKSLDAPTSPWLHPKTNHLFIALPIIHHQSSGISLGHNTHLPQPQASTEAQLGPRGVSMIHEITWRQRHFEDHTWKARSIDRVQAKYASAIAVHETEWLIINSCKSSVMVMKFHSKKYGS